MKFLLNLSYFIGFLSFKITTADDLGKNSSVMLNSSVPLNVTNLSKNATNFSLSVIKVDNYSNQTANVSLSLMVSTPPSVSNMSQSPDISATSPKPFKTMIIGNISIPNSVKSTNPPIAEINSSRGPNSETSPSPPPKLLILNSANSTGTPINSEINSSRGPNSETSPTPVPKSADSVLNFSVSPIPKGGNPPGEMSRKPLLLDSGSLPSTVATSPDAVSGSPSGAALGGRSFVNSQSLTSSVPQFAATPLPSKNRIMPTGNS